VATSASEWIWNQPSACWRSQLPLSQGFSPSEEKRVLRMGLHDLGLDRPASTRPICAQSVVNRSFPLRDPALLCGWKTAAEMQAGLPAKEFRIRSCAAGVAFYDRPFKRDAKARTETHLYSAVSGILVW
jgi:hypothetical protein